MQASEISIDVDEAASVGSEGVYGLVPMWGMATLRLEPTDTTERLTMGDIMAMTATVEPGPSATDIEDFRGLVARWKNETAHIASPERMLMHSAYLQIIGMGKPILPLLFRELRDSPDYWFMALAAITKTNAAAGVADFETARDRWLQWGRDHRFVTGGW